ncbi:MAG: hypothetical protein ACYDD7_05390, partial [Acidimicrobiales bacterium]
QPWGISIDRWAAFIDELASVGYFDPATKVGILIDDDGTGRNQHLVNDVWLPHLAALHIPVASQFTYTGLQGFSDASSASGQMSSAVLRFRSAGVNHVLLTPSGGTSELFFTNEANSQSYYPRLALNDSYPLAATAAIAPAASLSGAIGIGWKPGGDAVSTSDMTSWEKENPSDPARSLCEQIYRGKNNGQPAPYALCDTLFFLQAALDKASSMSPTGLLAGVEALGTSWPTANGYGPTQFGPSRYDGGAQIRPLKYNPSAGRFTYIGPLKTIP